ncbi:MAG: N-acetylmuramoyl-L-alanine amidase [Firmicutes bacterium]|nr:N-acetylmuramoyl-L-alanine amidase [Bacillota bacterium]
MPLGRAFQPVAPPPAVASPITEPDSASLREAPASPPDRNGAPPTSRGERGRESAPSSFSPTDFTDPADAPTATPEPQASVAPLPSPTAAQPRPRVGIQVGHWKNSELPRELSALVGSTGAAGNGWREVDVNLDIARRVVGLLEKQSLQVDLIPATVPIGYKAGAFVALHGDANSNTSLSGYKLARARWSKIPDKDDALLQSIAEEYQARTGLQNHPSTITANMWAYYAFDYRSLDHAVAPTTPSVILEMGFLSTYRDRQLLLEQPDRAAQGVANGILKFLGMKEQ